MVPRIPKHKQPGEKNKSKQRNSDHELKEPKEIDILEVK
jgi:hypothetical protein